MYELLSEGSVFLITPGVHTPNPSKSGARRPDDVLRVPQVLDCNRRPFGSLLPGVLCLLRPRLLQHDDDECDTAPNYTRAFHAQPINIFRFTAAIQTVRCWRITRKVCSHDRDHTPRRLALLRQTVCLVVGLSKNSLRRFQSVSCTNSNMPDSRSAVLHSVDYMSPVCGRSQQITSARQLQSSFRPANTTVHPLVLASAVLYCFATLVCNLLQPCTCISHHQRSTQPCTHVPCLSAGQWLQMCSGVTLPSSPVSLTSPMHMLDSSTPPSMHIAPPTLPLLWMMLPSSTQCCTPHPGPPTNTPNITNCTTSSTSRSCSTSV